MVLAERFATHTARHKSALAHARGLSSLAVSDFLSEFLPDITVSFFKVSRETLSVFKLSSTNHVGRVSRHVCAVRMHRKIPDTTPVNHQFAGISPYSEKPGVSMMLSAAASVLIVRAELTVE